MNGVESPLPCTSSWYTLGQAEIYLLGNQVIMETAGTSIQVANPRKEITRYINVNIVQLDLCKQLEISN